MLDYQQILEIAPFALPRDEKRALYTEQMSALCQHHYDNCSPYAKVMDTLGHDIAAIHSIEDIPFIPVRLFKMFELSSVPQDEIFKTLTSSGTTGQAVSKIFLDKETASNQQKTLVKIFSDFTGASRMPMLIIDNPSVVKDRKNFSARGAGILGFSIFGADRTYALDDDMNINIEAIERFLDKHKGKDILLFGFTFMIWQHFYKALKASNTTLDLSNGRLVHGGGWKKLINEAVSPEAYKQALHDVTGINHVHDYYGMVEQTGCITMECDEGHMHTSIFSDVIMRRAHDFSVCDEGEAGLIQLLSLLPRSYPGHSILSEDEGILLGEDDCACGRKGKYFKVLGRIKNAEVRGCSDTYGQR